MPSELICDELPKLLFRQFWVCAKCDKQCKPYPISIGGYTDEDVDGNLFEVPIETMWISDCHHEYLLVYDDDVDDFVELPENA